MPRLQVVSLPRLPKQAVARTTAALFKGGCRDHPIRPRPALRVASLSFAGMGPIPEMCVFSVPDDADEAEMAFNDDYSGSSASRVFWEAPSSGSYYVAVASWGDGTGSYTLTIIVR